MKLTQKGNVRHKRRAISALTAFLLIAVMLVANVALYVFTVEKNTYIDVTNEGLYTLTDEMKKTVSEINTDVTITFCADPDKLLSGYETRYVYVMAKEIEKQNDKIKVETVNISKNPTAIQKFKTTAATKIKASDVIISSGDRFRIISAASFWYYDQTSSYYFSYDGEYKMATAILSVASRDEYTAYFTVGHGERVYDEANPDAEGNAANYEFYRLLRDCGMKVKTINLDTEDIPEDCILLIMNAPTKDYASKPDGYMYVNYTSPVEKIDRYLDNFGSLMVFTDPFTVLPELEEYLTEWGMQINHLQVKDRLNSLNGDSAEASRNVLTANYASSENNPIGYSLYSDIINLAGTPKTIVENSGYISRYWDTDEIYNSRRRTSMYSAVLLSSLEASAYTEDGLLADRDGGYHLASITSRYHSSDAADYSSYVFVAASSNLTDSEYLSNGTYANYDLMFAVVRNISRVDVYASDSLGGANMNSSEYGGKRLVLSSMFENEHESFDSQKVTRQYAGLLPKDKVILTAVILFVPVIIIPALCVYITTKRKYL